jgi:hypothetical protein
METLDQTKAGFTPTVPWRYLIPPWQQIQLAGTHQRFAALVKNRRGKHLITSSYLDQHALQLLFKKRPRRR